MPEIIMAFASLAFLIIYALKTRRMAESMVLCLLLAVGAFPKIGPLKRAYQRVQAGGPAFERDEKAEKLVDIADVDESRVSPAWNAMVPLAVLVGGTILFGNDLVHGMVLAIIAQFLLYVPQKIMTVKQFFEHFFNGAKGMTSLAIVVCFGFMLSEANRELGLFDILINGIGGTVPAALVPPLAFLLVGATVFAVGGCCAARACFDRVQAGAGIREGVRSRSSRVLNSTARRFSGILPSIYNEGGVIPIWILTAVTIRVTS